jgi:hypothetical protein
MAAIASVQEFDEHHANGLIPELHNLPPEVVQEFRDHLKFVDGGLAHSEYSMLQGHVADENLASIFGHFGIDEAKFESIRDTSCVSRVCFVSPRSFCDPDRCRKS